MAKQVKVNSFQHFLYVEVDGKQIQIKEVDSIEEYGKDVVVYSKEAAKGVKKGSTLYAVALADYIPKKRVSTKESVKSMLASGLTPEQIVAQLAGN